MSDLINRKDVMKIFNTAFRGDIPYAIMGGLIKGLPSIESPSADRPKGEWLYLENEPYSKCSVCGAYIDDLDDEKFNYCPCCGADMKGRCEDE